MLVCLRNGQTIATLFAGTKAADWSVIGLSNSRNQVIKSFTGIVGTEDAGAIRYNVHIPIPKMFQRIREGDQWVLVWNSFSPGPLTTAFRYKDFS